MFTSRGSQQRVLSVSPGRGHGVDAELLGVGICPEHNALPYPWPWEAVSWLMSIRRKDGSWNSFTRQSYHNGG